MRYEELFELDTELTADACEWCPVADGEGRHVLASACYQLNKETRQRSGCLHMLELEVATTNDDDDANANANDARLVSHVRHEYASSGILDLRWLDERRLVTVDSSNTLDVLAYDRERHVIEPVSRLPLSKSDEDESPPIIGLTLDRHDSRLIVGDSAGHVSVVDSVEQRVSGGVTARFKAHSLEVWSVLADRCGDEHTVYSGADDCELRMWDVRVCASDSDKPSTPVAISRVFQGGVCSIVQQPSGGGNSLYCGSYDERIYELDKRNMRRSVRESPRLGGGVWKMKLSDDGLLLAACMHIGVRVVDTAAAAAASFDSMLHYESHGVDTLAYGCDWTHSSSKSRANKSPDLVATCSFYNHLLKVWRIVY